MKLILFFILLSFNHAPLERKDDFKIIIQRTTTQKNLVYGQLFLNGVLVGNCYENADLKIPAGSYKGVTRYKSGKNFVQSASGKLAKIGDFLLEVSGVPNRTDILFHAGNKPYHSKGCVLLGPVNKGPDGSATLDSNHPLRKLRVKFYGSENPTSCPDKNITIEIRN